MKIFILGVSGLIGHKLYQGLSRRFNVVEGAMHGSYERFSKFDLFDKSKIKENVCVEDFQATFDVLAEADPDVILNCAGITRRRPEIGDLRKAIRVNALFPHELSNWAKEHGKRVIHFSTDCVFDGTIGNYGEDDRPTPEDTYGSTKALGEIRYDHTLTIRSSFIGQELAVHSELLAWFLQQEGKTIGGFTNALYSGVSTIEMSRVVGDIIEHHPDLNGLYNLSVAEPITKYELLVLAKEAYGLDVQINKDPSLVTKPTLDGSKLRSAIGLELPSWKEMMEGLASQRKLYD